MVVDLRGTAQVGTVVVVAGRTGVVMVDRKRLRAARQRAHLTQAQLGALLGHGSGDLVGEWERGRTRPDVHSLRKLAEVLKIKARELLAPQTPITLEVLRVLAGLTQAEAAEAIRRRLVVTVGPDARMSRETWAATERGKREPGRDELDAIAAVFGVDSPEVVKAAGTTPATTPEIVELSPDQAAQLEAARRPGESLADVLGRLLAGDVDQDPPNT